MDKLKIIGNNIKILRKQAKLSQERLCERIPMDRTYLSELENGKVNFTIETIIKIANAIGCKTIDLFADVDSDDDVKWNDTKTNEILDESQPIGKSLTGLSDDAAAEAIIKFMKNN